MSTVTPSLARARRHSSPTRLAAVGLAVVAAVTASLALPGHPRIDPATWAVVAMAALLYAGCALPSGLRLWMRYGTATTSVLVALLVATTGAADSNYQDLFVVLLVTSAVLKDRWSFTVDLAVVVAAALAPAIYADVGSSYLSDLVVDLGTWSLVASVARLLTTQVAAATTDLAESDQRFELLARDIPAVVYRQSLTGSRRLVWTNAQSRSILGYTPQQLVGEPDLVPSRVPVADQQAFLSARHDPVAGQSGIVQYRFERADGRMIWLEDHYMPVTGSDGQPIAVLGVVFDATARVQAEQALRDAHENDRLARDELGRVLRAQQGFIQGISHELRTPLTTVAGFATLLAEHDEDLTPERRRELTGRLLASTERLTELVDDLVDVERLLGDTEHRLAPAPHDVLGVVQEAARQVTSDEHDLHVDGNPGLGTVDADVLGRITRQLLDNATRHTPAGTRIECRVDKCDGTVRLTVEDDGPGIPEEMMHAVFDPFVQGPEAMAAANPGTGIGLPLAMRLARAHGGHVWHERPDGRGARFVATLRTP